jgi:hypothetical protein
MKAIGNTRIKNRYTGKGYVGSDLAWCVAEMQSTLTISGYLRCYKGSPRCYAVRPVFYFSTWMVPKHNR